MQVHIIARYHWNGGFHMNWNFVSDWSLLLSKGKSCHVKYKYCYLLDMGLVHRTDNLRFNSCPLKECVLFYQENNQPFHIDSG